MWPHPALPTFKSVGEPDYILSDQNQKDMQNAELFAADKRCSDCQLFILWTKQTVSWPALSCNTLPYHTAPITISPQYHEVPNQTKVYHDNIMTVCHTKRSQSRKNQYHSIAYLPWSHAGSSFSSVPNTDRSFTFNRSHGTSGPQYFLAILHSHFWLFVASLGLCVF